MNRNLTDSSLERQNILNNRYALQQAERHLNLGGISFEGETVFTKAQVTALYEVTERTIGRYLVSHEKELKSNGNQVIKGKKLKYFKGLLDGTDIHDGTKTYPSHLRMQKSMMPMRTAGCTKATGETGAKYWQLDFQII